MILITGASGTVGREVARRLAGKAPVRLASRDPGRAGADIVPEGAEAVRFDFRDPSCFADALRGVRRVFLLRPPRLARPRRDFGPFLSAMQGFGVEAVAFLSVRGAGENPLLPHRGIERMLEASGLAWTHLRPNDFMQNFATVHRADIRDRGEIWAPAGSGRTSFVDVRDVAEAAVRVLTEPGHERRAYTLTGSDALDMWEAAGVFSEVLGRRVVYRNPGVLAFLRHVRAGGRPASLGLVMTGVYTVARLGWAAGVSPELERLTGRPPTGLRGFVEDHARLWQPPGGSA